MAERTAWSRELPKIMQVPDAEYTDEDEQAAQAMYRGVYKLMVDAPSPTVVFYTLIRVLVEQMILSGMASNTLIKAIVLVGKPLRGCERLLVLKVAELLEELKAAKSRREGQAPS